jgi:predicted RNA methylase
MKDWAAWHSAYDDPSSPLSIRLRCVQSHLSDAIDQAPAGRVQLVSLCAGQGRDVIGVLARHHRCGDVCAVLVESDPRNVAMARQAASGRGLSQVEIRCADASLVDGFADALPADVLLLCGIFGNVSDRDIQRTVQAAAALCREGATVIWTRHRRPPDLTPQLRAWFADSGFQEIAFDAPDTSTMIGVGAHRLSHPSAAGPPSQRLFTFGAT